MRFTNLRAKVCVVITWIYGILFSVVPLLDIGLGSYVPEGYLTSCSYDYLTDNYNARLFIFIFFIAAWVIPFFLISYCYSSILSVVVTQRKFKGNIGASAESTRHVKQEEKKKQELKLAMVVFLVIGLWFAAWTPYSVVSLLGICGRLDLIQPFYSMIPALFCKTASCADPFVYAFTHPRFKAEMAKMFFKSNGRASRRVWSSDGHQMAAQNREEPTYVLYDEPEIELVAIKNVVGGGKAEGFTAGISEDDMKVKQASFKKPWWYRPSFNDRFSSIRYLQRSLSKGSQKDGQEADDCEHVSI